MNPNSTLTNQISLFTGSEVIVHMSGSLEPSILNKEH